MTPNSPLTVTQRRPDRRPPPSDLNDMQRDVWVAIVNSKPAAWLDAARVPLLVAFVRHASTADLLSRLIAAFGPKWLADDAEMKRLQLLTEMRAQETKAMLTAANSLSLTQLRSLR